ncbi:MAG: J domain-containing protein [Kastovskya adunca ATA6-11-RM4]|jgi:curved DNA-binding protein CbpA|nr:J domain-containing protein [Kastovskya adunca ATA6-11-RM4]
MSDSISYYTLLGLHPSASPIEIRRSYRELSKHYHPDTTDLPAAVATAKFQQINEAYATLSNLERRRLYDQKIGYSRLNVIQVPPGFNPPSCPRQPQRSNNAYLDPTDRPLSAGELFALFVLGLTFLGCVILAIAIGLTRGDAAFQRSEQQNVPVQEQVVSLQPLAPNAPTIPHRLKSNPSLHLLSLYNPSK